MTTNFIALECLIGHCTWKLKFLLCSCNEFHKNSLEIPENPCQFFKIISIWPFFHFIRTALHSYVRFNLNWTNKRVLLGGSISRKKIQTIIECCFFFHWFETHSFLNFVLEISICILWEVIAVNISCTMSCKSFHIDCKLSQCTWKADTQQSVKSSFSVCPKDEDMIMPQSGISQHEWRTCVRACGIGRSVSAWNCARTSNKPRHSDWEQSVQQHGYETSVGHVPSLREYFGRMNGVLPTTKHTIFQVDSVELWW